LSEDSTGRTPPERLPLAVLTGFLGSGKTTVLRHLLQQPEMANTAVIINEFGEIGLDDALVETADEDVVTMASGCLCCTIRSDLANTLHDLFLRRRRGEVAPFERVIVETTGLADPAPILHTLMTDPLMAARFRLDAVVATVDAANGAATLDAHAESVKQAAVADRVLLTKTDLADAAALEERLRALNPAAPLIKVAHGAVDPDRLFGAGLYNPATKSVDVVRWLNEAAYADDHAHHHDVNRHDDRIRAYCLSHDRLIAWAALADWLDALTAMRGPDLLRLKGVVHVSDTDGPVVLHAVQHIFHPPVLLDAWPDDDRRSRLVFITREMPKVAVEKMFRAFVEQTES